VQRISDQDIKPFEPKRAWNKKVSFVDEALSSDSDEEPVIGLAEWVKNKKPMKIDQHLTAQMSARFSGNSCNRL